MLLYAACSIIHSFDFIIKQVKCSLISKQNLQDLFLYYAKSMLWGMHFYTFYIF